MTERDMKYWAAFCRRNQSHIDNLMDYFTNVQMDPKEGQMLLVFLAGMSRGIQGLGPLDSNVLTEAMAVGWQLGAREREQ